MKKFALFVMLALLSTDCLARGGFSSGGSRGGFRSAPRTTVTRTTTINRSYTSYHPMMYGGMGMGYGYSNGIITGIIIGNLMHPQGTVAYNGGGTSGPALLYPDGRVVDQNGMQIGTYINGQFTAVQGGMVAQPAPSDWQQSEDKMSTIGVLATTLITIVLIVFLIMVFA
jgi:hypothetical protein